MLRGTWNRAQFHPVSYAVNARLFARQPLGWILHVVVGNGSPYGTFERAVSPNRRFSHLWVAKDGRIEQYQRLELESWAQAGGNGTYWSVETEGYPGEELTAQQLHSLAAWHVFCGASDTIADQVGQVGIGTHSMGGKAWGSHACPGIVRSAQRGEILRQAQILRGLAPASSPTSAGPRYPLTSSAVFSRDTHSGYNSTTDRGHIRTWQARMAERGWTITVDGLFGPQTEYVLRQFQSEKGLAVDGLLGPVSWSAAWTTPVT